jgi:hypothetical protein
LRQHGTFIEVDTNKFKTLLLLRRHGKRSNKQGVGGARNKTKYREGVITELPSLSLSSCVFISITPRLETSLDHARIMS